MSVPPERWLARLVTFGRTRNGLRIERPLGPAIVQHALAAPVRFVVLHGRRDHPGDDANPWDPATLVGTVESAWVDETGVSAHLCLGPTGHALRVRYGLTAIERDGRLPDLAPLSLMFRHVAPEARIESDGSLIMVVTTLTRLVAVDLVYAAGADGAAILRSLSPHERIP